MIPVNLPTLRLPRIALTFISIAAIAILLNGCCAAKLGKPIDNYPVSAVFSTIHDQVKSALDSLKRDPAVTTTFTVLPTEADLVLDNVVTADAGASLSILIFSPNYTRTWKKETTLTFSLLNTASTPPVQPMIANNRPLRLTIRKDTNALKNLIISTAEQMAKIPFNFDQSNPDSTQRKIEIDIAFTLDNSYGIQIGGSLISSLSATGSLGLDMANTHTIMIKFQLNRKTGS